jgi:hypothetical protein
MPRPFSGPRIIRSPALFRWAERLIRKPAYQFAFFMRDGLVQARVRTSTQVMELPMDWAFGAGRQAITFVSRINSDWYVEHYASYFPAAHVWGPTPGQDGIQPVGLPQAAGLLYNTIGPYTGVDGCFRCHSTGPLGFGPGGEIQPREPGVHCEACHGPGGEHAGHPSRANISNPARLNSGQLNHFCGKCHRSPAGPGEPTDWSYSWTVRHQPAYLSQSACFRLSGGSLSCIHATTHTSPQGQRGWRSTTIGAQRAIPVRSCPRRVRAAPTALTATCPLVSPQANLRFTNHWIGVYRDGAKLKASPRTPNRQPNQTNRFIPLRRQ